MQELKGIFSEVWSSVPDYLRESVLRIFSLFSRYFPRVPQLPSLQGERTVIVDFPLRS